MPAAERCAICESRKARRACPVKGAICSPCCGQEREVTIDCPMDCEFLIESRIHDKEGPLDEAVLRDFKVTDEFLRANQPLFTATAMAMLNGVLDTEGSVDNDIRECLDSALRNRKVRESGLVYEGKPENRIAAGILEVFERRLVEFRKESEKWEGFPRIKDSDETKMVAFLRALESSHNNGRPKSRAFIHFLYGIAAQQLPPESPESLTAAQ